jgi:hypothetical protein
MATQQNIPTVSSSDYGRVKAWLYNNYVHDESAAAATTTNDDLPSLLSRPQFDRIHLSPMIAGFTLAPAPGQLKEDSSHSSESEDQSAALPPQNTVSESSDEISGSEGSVQHAQPEPCSNDSSMFDPETAPRYTRARGLSFCSAYQEARRENAALEGYNADVESNADTLTDSEERSLIPDETTVPSTTETSWIDSQDEEDEEARFVETTTKKIEFEPVVRALTKKMNHSHARERQVAWTCAAWAFRRVDDSLEGYAVLKGQLDMLYDRQMEAREALVKDIEEWRAYGAALELVL